MFAYPLELEESCIVYLTEGQRMATSPKYKRNQNKLAIVYARYSSHSQNEASIEQQLEMARQYAKEHDLVIVKEYYDKAQSGRKDDRPNLNLMLSEVTKIKPSTLILYKGDRLARDRTIAVISKHTLKKAGCFPVYITEDVDTETPEGKLLEGLLEVVASFYVDQSKVNVERGMQSNARLCQSNGSKKYGYRTDKATKQYVIEELEANIVQEIYTRYDKGEKPKDIADDLNSRGIRTLQGKPWRVDSVAKILRNPSYKGVYKWRDHEIEGGMPRIIDDDLWERVEKRRLANKRHKRQEGKHADYWLVPKLHCAECGGLMSGAYGKSGGNNKQYYYYRCTNKECSTGNISKERLEKATLKILGSILSEAGNIAELAARAYAQFKKESSNKEFYASLSAKRKEVESQINNLMEAIKSGIITDQIKEEMFKLEDERDGLNEALALEEAKLALCNSEESIQEYINKYIYANLENLEELKEVFNWFVVDMAYGNDTLAARCRYMDETEWIISYNEDDEVHRKPFGATLEIGDIQILDEDDPSLLSIEEVEAAWRIEVERRAKERGHEILDNDPLIDLPDI